MERVTKEQQNCAQVKLVTRVKDQAYNLTAGRKAMIHRKGTNEYHSNHDYLVFSPVSLQMTAGAVEIRKLGK